MYSVALYWLKSPTSLITFVRITWSIRDAEIWLFNSFKIIQQRLFTASSFNLLTHRKKQSGKVSMFYFINLGKVFCMNKYWILCYVFCISPSCYIHAKFEVASFKTNECTGSFSLFRMFIFTWTFTGPLLCAFLPSITALFYFREPADYTNHSDN